MMKYIGFVVTLIALGWIGCTPKTATKATKETATPTPPQPTVNLDSVLADPCRTWQHLPQREELIETHVIYQDYMSMKNYDEAFPLWKQVYEAAPMADGKRYTHFKDGITLYRHFLTHDTTGQRIREYSKNIDAIVQHWIQCASRDSTQLAEQLGQIAFDLYYEFLDVVDSGTVMDLFEQAVQAAGDSVPVFVFNPMSRLLVDLVLQKKIDTARAATLALHLLKALQYGKAHCKGDCDDWNIVESYTPDVLARLENIRNFYPCSYYKDKYLPLYEEDSTNCEIVRRVFLKLRWGGCDETDPDLRPVVHARKTRCKILTKNADLQAAQQAMEKGDFSTAIRHYQQYIQNTDDPDKKARIALRIAQLYYVFLKNFPKARYWALQAAKYKPNWGEPYILIGTLYASSGPLCGPGTGWDSQVVVWAAIDKWEYAKKIDPSVAPKANKLIRSYQKFMPTKADIFQRMLRIGDKFRVRCWIQETTTIRAKP